MRYVCYPDAIVGLPTDLINIVCEFCGDLRQTRQRLHLFCGLEVYLWGIIRGSAATPRYIRRQYRLCGPERVKEILQIAYLKTHRNP